MAKRLIIVMAMATVWMVASVAAAYAHECVNVHKEPGAGTQAINHNGGVAGFVVRPDDVEVFIHPSVSQNPILSPFLPGAPGQFTGFPGHAGSLPEGAHESSGWTEVPFGV